MRLLFNGSYLQLPHTGIATYCRNLLAQWRFSYPELVTYLPQGEPASHSIPPTNHLTRLLWNQAHWPRTVRRGDLVFHPVPESGWGSYPQVTMAHDVIPLRYPEYFPRKLAYFRYWVPLSLASAQHIVCNSQQTGQDLTTFYKIPPEKITVIPLACDREKFFPHPGTKTEVPYLLYLGSHEPHKNLSTLIQAFSRLDWSGQLWIGGRFDPRYTPALQAQAGPQVRWLDYCREADLPQLYRGALAFVYPSRYEGFGLPLLEAMACGTAVIAADTPALVEVAGTAASYFEADDLGGLTALLTQIISDPHHRQNQQTRALARAQNFNWADTAAQTLEVCREVYGRA